MGIEDKVNAAIASDLRVYARRRWPLENDKYRKHRLASLLGFSARRIKSLWEAEQTAVIRQHEAEAVRKLLGQQEIAEANRNDIQALQDRIARLEAAITAQDEEFGRAQMAGYREAVGLGRRDDEPAEPINHRGT